MSTNEATLKQAAHLLTFIAQKGTSLEQLQQIYNSGLLSDLLEANIAQVNRNEFCKALKLGLIRVDRSARPTYPDWLEQLLHPEFEGAGPSEYYMGDVEQWRHEGQERGIFGARIYDYLRDNQMLESCLGFDDLLAIQSQGPVFFRRYFGKKVVFGLRSIGTSGRLRSRMVPLLRVHRVEDGVMLEWHSLHTNWRLTEIALRFAG